MTRIPDVRTFAANSGEEEDSPTSFFKIQLLPEFIDDAMLTVSTVVEEWLREPDEFIASIRKCPMCSTRLGYGCLPPSVNNACLCCRKGVSSHFKWRS